MKLAGTYRKDFLSMFLIIIILAVVLVRLGGADTVTLCWDEAELTVTEKNKYLLLLLPALAVFLFFMMTYYEKYPEAYNWTMQVRNYNSSKRSKESYKVLAKYLYLNKIFMLCLVLSLTLFCTGFCTYSSYLLLFWTALIIINSVIAAWRMSLWKKK